MIMNFSFTRKDTIFFKRNKNTCKIFKICDESILKNLSIYLQYNTKLKLIDYSQTIQFYTVLQIVAKFARTLLRIYHDVS